MNQSPQKKGSNLPTETGGMLADFIRQVRLVWRLFFDPRVPLWVKSIPVASLAYVIWPLDLIAGIPGLSAVDDLGVIAIGIATFINLCPPDLVEEHMQALMGETGWRVEPPGQSDDSASSATPKVIDAPSYTIDSEEDQDSSSP